MAARLAVANCRPVSSRPVGWQIYRPSWRETGDRPAAGYGRPTGLSRPLATGQRVTHFICKSHAGYLCKCAKHSLERQERPGEQVGRLGDWFATWTTDSGTGEPASRLATWQPSEEPRQAERKSEQDDHQPTACS